MPEVLKHFIVANSAVLFALMLIAACVGVWVTGKTLLRFVRRRLLKQNGLSDHHVEPGSSLSDALWAAHRRIDQLEALVTFDRDLRGER